jgi:IclR family acetate operon transcriptional repressor
MGAAAYLSSYEDGEIVLMDVADGPGMKCVDLWVGMRDAAHATAFGKCILSATPPPTPTTTSPPHKNSPPASTT